MWTLSGKFCPNGLMRTIITLTFSVHGSVRVFTEICIALGPLQVGVFPRLVVLFLFIIATILFIRVLG